MAILEIITYPHPILRQRAEEITTFDDKLKILAQNMGETMYHAPGIGLAANQVALAKRIVVVDISQPEQEKNYLPLINPVISDGEGKVIDEEGCLSIRDYQAKVPRFRKIHVTAQNLDGSPLEFDAEDRFARVIQHEVDHLNGKLYIDRISSLKRTLYKKKLKKILQQDGR
ncbi:MAG: peptide deformylase [Desulfobulbus propionicus]|nr:MAG: peptide deformylase [Desulfobulbus propionicus]